MGKQSIPIRYRVHNGEDETIHFMKTKNLPSTTNCNKILLSAFLKIKRTAI